MNDLVAGDSAPSRDLARHALNAVAWDSAEAVAKFGGTQLQATRQALYDQLVPLKVVEPKLDGPESADIRKWLRTLGCKVRPDFSNDQAEAWLGSVLVALSDLPPRCAFRACVDAIHTPFQFVNEAEAKIRELAEAEKARQQRAISRLDAMQAELLRARDTSHQLESRLTNPLATEEVHSLQRGPMGKELVRMGLALGAIQPDQLLPPEELTQEEQDQ